GGGPIALLRRAADRTGRRPARRLPRNRLPTMGLRPGLAPLRHQRRRRRGGLVAPYLEFRETLRGRLSHCQRTTNRRDAVSAKADKVKTVFLAALDKSPPAARAAYLDEACAGDSDLRTRVEALLAVHDRPDPLLDPPAAQHVDVEDDAALDFLEPSAKPGSLGRLGHYEVLEVLGRGSMGIVLGAF